MAAFGDIKLSNTLGMNLTSSRTGIGRTPLIVKGTMIKTLNSTNFFSITPSEIGVDDSVNSCLNTPLLVCNGHYESCAAVYSNAKWNPTNNYWDVTLHDRSTGDLFTQNGSLRVNYAWFGSPDDASPVFGNIEMQQPLGSQLTYSSNTISTNPKIYLGMKTWNTANTNNELQIYASDFGLSGNLKISDFIAAIYWPSPDTDPEILIPPTATYYNTGGYFFFPTVGWQSEAVTGLTRSYRFILIR